MTVARTTLAATIASGTSLSNAVDLYGYDFTALEFPAGWDAAAVTFQTSEDGVTYRNVYMSNGTEASFSGAAANRWVAIDATLLGLFGRFVKVRSGTGAVPVNQTADRIIGVVGRGV